MFGSIYDHIWMVPPLERNLASGKEIKPVLTLIIIHTTRIHVIRVVRLATYTREKKLFNCHINARPLYCKGFSSLLGFETSSYLSPGLLASPCPPSITNAGVNRDSCRCRDLLTLKHIKLETIDHSAECLHCPTIDVSIRDMTEMVCTRLGRCHSLP
ncbi:hypothetical protein BGZ61DRAFT_201620 [Ilyonectria robusta]|uniref:uncharacterized protein n=1 Tax=Ilyonectria robusta TaxID=1079257 RepID=UPI001E8CDE79|nr:uncharacterized protein BGZ61DRAFT_201620 [Ilyonectria robusta]KAH8722218.1 hypothetical protein BGZ61DRAFT_201620 [Ilyonectria robusta]